MERSVSAATCMAQILENTIVSCNVRTERDRNLCAMHVVFRFVSSLLRTARTCDTSGGARRVRHTHRDTGNMAG